MLDNGYNRMMYYSLSKNFFARLVYALSCLLVLSSFQPILSQENNNAKVHYPANITECIEELKRTLPPKGNVLDEFKSHPVEIANDYHLTLGMWIRNNWIHSGDGVLMAYFEKMGIYHPDDMSGIILVSLWRDLHSLPINLEEQINKYKKMNFYEAATVRDRRLVPDDIWNKPLSLNNGNIIRLSNFKGKIIVLLLFEYDSLSSVAISGLDALQDKFSKWNVSVIGLHEGGKLYLKDDQPYAGPKSRTFPLVDVERQFIWRIQDVLISPGLVEWPEVILIGKDGNMIVRFNEWEPDAASKKALCDEIVNALKIQ